MRTDSISATTNTASVELQTIWTKQQVTQLKTLVQQGMPSDQIAMRLKRPLSAIKLEAAALGLNLNSK
jgi:hypothetical protein